MATQALIVTDIGYGDAGKGSVTDYLVRQARSAVVVRFNGGAQAAHNVLTPEGRHHTFAQFGSGSFVPGVRTHLSRYMLLNPLNMMAEADHLELLGVTDVWQRTSVGEDAILITPWQRSANRLRELARGNGRHGSCGEGIGETQSDALRNPEMVIRARDVQNPARLLRKLRTLRDYKYDQLTQELGLPEDEAAATEWQVFTDQAFLDELQTAFWQWADLARIVDGEYLGRLVEAHELVVFEGAQGVLLDEWRGFHPHTTWSTTTPHNALALLDEMEFGGEVTRLGLLRAYATRHGAGPFVTEDPVLTTTLPDYHNGQSDWAGSFRIGHLDLVALRYALAACEGCDELVVSSLDRMAEVDDWQYCDRYRFTGKRADAERFFTFDDQGLVTDMKLGPRFDLDYQAHLTSLLADCHPVYSSLESVKGSVSDRQDELLRVIENRLGCRVALASFGPTAVQKRCFAAAL